MKINKQNISLSLLVTILTIGMGTVYSQTLEVPPNVANDVIDIDGSSTVFPITEAVQKEFAQLEPDLKVNVAFSGTGGGFKKFCAGETDINGASRPISTQEMEACRNAGIGYIEIPIAFDALTVVVNPQNNWVDNITTDQLKTMWQTQAQDKINTWQQVNPQWPNQDLDLYGPGTDSGTYDYFAEVITGSDIMRSDFTSSEDDDIIAQGVINSPNALGFFGISYYLQNQDKLKALSVNGVSPSRETVENAAYQPLSRPIFIYINIQSAQNNPQFRQFIDFYLKNAPRIIEEVGYIPLPEEAYVAGMVRFNQGKVGTVFQGVPQPNLTIEEVLQLEQAF